MTENPLDGWNLVRMKEHLAESGVTWFEDSTALNSAEDWAADAVDGWVKMDPETHQLRPMTESEMEAFTEAAGRVGEVVDLASRRVIPASDTLTAPSVNHPAARALQQTTPRIQ